MIFILIRVIKRIPIKVLCLIRIVFYFFLWQTYLILLLEKRVFNIWIYVKAIIQLVLNRWVLLNWWKNASTILVMSFLVVYFFLIQVWFAESWVWIHHFSILADIRRKRAPFLNLFALILKLIQSKMFLIFLAYVVTIFKILAFVNIRSSLTINVIIRRILKVPERIRSSKFLRETGILIILFLGLLTEMLSAIKVTIIICVWNRIRLHWIFFFIHNVNVEIIFVWLTHLLAALILKRFVLLRVTVK